MLWKQYTISYNTLRFLKHKTIFYHSSCSHMLSNTKVHAYHVQAQFSGIFRELTQTLKNVLYFLVELKPMFLGSFQGSQTQFQSQRLVMLLTNMCVIADHYNAGCPDKPRIIWSYKINMLLFIFLLVHELRLFVCIWSSIWNSTWGNEAWYRCPWRNIRLVKLELVLFRACSRLHELTMPCCVTAVCLCKIIDSG